MSVPCRIGAVEIGDRRRAREARIDHDQLGVVVGLRLGHPLEAARMRLGGVAAHDDDDIGVLDVQPEVRHRATAECWGQTGHRRSVSDTRLIIEHQCSSAADHLVGQIGASRWSWPRRQGSRW